MSPEMARLRQAVIEARRRWATGQGSQEAMNEAADAYIGAVAAWMKAKGRKGRPPSRATLLRAL